MAKPNPIPLAGDVDLEKLLKRLSEDIVEAPAFLRLHTLLGVKFGKYQREVNQSAFFWTFSAKAILEAGLLRIARIYDQEQSALSLRRLLLTIQANPHFFEDESVKKRVNPLYAEGMQPGSHALKPNEIVADLVLVSDGDPLVDKIIRWRNTLGAHISPKRMLKNPPARFNFLTPDDAFALCDRAFDVFNRYSSLFHATTHSRKIIGEDDTEFLFKYLRMGLDAYNKQVEDEFKQWEILAKKHVKNTEISPSL